MKKILFSLIIACCASAAQAQRVNLYVDSTCSVPYCNIVPVECKIGDTTHACKMSISTFADNQISSCEIYWQLLDAKCNKVSDGNIALMGDDYTAWTDKNYLYNYVAGKLSVTIK